MSVSGNERRAAGAGIKAPCSHTQWSRALHRGSSPAAPAMRFSSPFIRPEHPIGGGGPFMRLQAEPIHPVRTCRFWNLHLVL